MYTYIYICIILIYILHVYNVYHYVHIPNFCGAEFLEIAGKRCSEFVFMFISYIYIHSIHMYIMSVMKYICTISVAQAFCKSQAKAVADSTHKPKTTYRCVQGVNVCMYIYIYSYVYIQVLCILLRDIHIHIYIYKYYVWYCMVSYVHSDILHTSILQKLASFCSELLAV